MLFQFQKSRQQQVGIFIRQSTAQALYFPLDGITDTVVLSTGKDVHIQAIKQHSLLVGLQFVILLDVTNHHQINQRSERLHQVIRQIKGVKRAAVMQAKRRQETVDRQRAGNTAPQDRITVVQPRIPDAVIAAGKPVSKQCREIILGGGRLYVAGIARAYLFDHAEKRTRLLRLSGQLQADRLISDLFPDNAPPYLFFCAVHWRQAGCAVQRAPAHADETVSAQHKAYASHRR